MGVPPRDTITYTEEHENQNLANNEIVNVNNEKPN